uniref:Uncharacterized protein n=1 Tax=Anguilla anguilla TaxID=7936 RepID=A0A0E9TBL9_ANGAN
MTSLIANHLEI